ncbi:XRE family transcriptional regulator [Sedimentibacter sp.]|uniref:helix-turn-helix domain-containing protein n=1 Tax=Sedimentibacter sp. TaxID=1960295 RepID=UPI0028A28095|nr:XRE family transcriptional regulator [Sedimentibacter sp.]
MDGRKVRKLRKVNDMTIEQLSEKTGFTASYISQVERNLIEPSLSALGKICKSLNVSPYYFLDDGSGVIVTRKEERQVLYVAEKDMEFEYLLPIENENNKVKLKVYKFYLNSGKWDNDNFSIIDSDKCVIILKGKLIVTFSDYNEILDEGDSIYISSYVPHKLFNPSDERAEVMFIITPS